MNPVRWRIRTWVLLTIIFTGVMAAWFFVGRQIILPRTNCDEPCACCPRNNCDAYGVLLLLLPLALWVLGIVVLVFSWVVTRIVRYWTARASAVPIEG